jgi:serine/threonine protein phosphatase PrpC
MPYCSAARTHVGTVRQRNEDAVLDRAEIGLWAVADGAGGHERGDYASACIIAALGEIDSALRGAVLLEEVKTRLSKVNLELRTEAARIGPDALIGTTVVVLLILGAESCCLWAGDSRFYRLRGGELRQLSRDQSHVQNLVDRGEISLEAAATHPLGNLVTNLVGGSDELALEERHDSVERGDILMLCTDGLSGAVTDTEIAGILREIPVPSAADRLIELALAKGARDNVSAVVVGYET